MLRKDTVDTQSAAPNTANPEVTAKKDAASQTLESGNSPSLNVTANVIVVQSNKNAQFRADVQEWLAANRGLNNHAYPFSNRVMDIFHARLREMDAADLAEKQRFFSQATLLLAAIKKCEELKPLLDVYYQLSGSETDRLFAKLIKQKCDEACFALDSNFSVSTHDLEDIISTVNRLVKLNNVLYQKINEQPARGEARRSSLYDDFYTEGTNMLYASKELAYTLLSKPAHERSQDLAALNTSLDHTRAIVTNPIANQSRVRQLQQDAIIMHQNPSLWRKLLGVICAVVSAVSLAIGVGLAVPTFGASIGIAGPVAYASAWAALSFFNMAAYGASAVSFFKGKQPISNALSNLASDAEAINKHHNSVRR